MPAVPGRAPAAEGPSPQAAEDEDEDIQSPDSAAVSPSVVESAASAKDVAAIAKAEDETSSEASWASSRSEPQDHHPEAIRRKCTDPFWVPLMALLSVGLFHLDNLHANHGGFRMNKRLIHWKHLTNWKFEVCGIGDLQDKPYLYFCLNQTAGGDVYNPILDLDHRICVATCPDSWSTTTPNCVDEHDLALEAPRSDYTTKVFQDMFCMPQMKALLRQVPYRKWRTRPMAYVNLILRNWHPFCFTVLGAVMFTFGVLVLLRNFVAMIVWGGIWLFVMVLPCISIFEYYCLSTSCHSPDLQQADKALFVVSLIGGLCMMRYAWKMGHSIAAAVECLEWALSFILATPSIIAVPLIVVPSRVCLVWVLRGSILKIISLFYADILNHLDLKWTPLEAFYTVYAVLLIYWIQHCISALADFVAVYASEVWYFRGGLNEDATPMPRCMMAKALFFAFRYHLGTLIMGGFVNGFTQPIRAVAKIFTSTGICQEAFGSCQACSKYSDAYFEVVLSSKSFLKAASRSEQTLQLHGDRDELWVLHGATRIFEVAIVGGMGCVGFFMTMLWQYMKGSTSSFSPAYIFNPTVFNIVGGIISAFTATPFVNMLTNVSETILYCHAVEVGMDQELEKEGALEGGFFDVSAFVSERVYCYCGYRPKHPQALPAASAVRRTKTK